MIKLAPILSDIACAAALWVLARKKLGEKSALLIAFAYLFCPAVIVNSSVWGQADSFCALLLLCTLLLLWYNPTPLAAFVYGFGILSKPQMLIFAPVLIFWVIRKKDWKNLVLGPIIALATILLFSTPFIKNFDYQFGVPLATVLAGLLLLKSKRDDAVFACPTVLMFTVYIFCVKMHERYLFPVLLCLLLTYVFTKEKRFLLLFAGISTVHFLNVAYVLYLNNAYISPTSIQILFLSALHVLL